MRRVETALATVLVGGQESPLPFALAAAEALAVISEPLARAEARSDVERRRLDRGQAAGGPRTR